jgi:hypothetical protein
VADILSLTHGLSSAARIAALCRRISILDTGTDKRKLADWEVVEIFQAYEEPIRRQIEQMPAAWRTVYFVAPLIWVSPVVPRVKLDDFRDKVVEGTNLTTGHPCLRLREFIALESRNQRRRVSERIVAPAC